MEQRLHLVSDPLILWKTPARISSPQCHNYLSRSNFGMVPGIFGNYVSLIYNSGYSCNISLYLLEVVEFLWAWYLHSSVQYFYWDLGDLLSLKLETEIKRITSYLGPKLSHRKKRTPLPIHRGVHSRQQHWKNNHPQLFLNRKTKKLWHNLHANNWILLQCSTFHFLYHSSPIS